MHCENMAVVELVNVGYGVWVYCDNIVVVELVIAGSSKNQN